MGHKTTLNLLHYFMWLKELSHGGSIQPGRWAVDVFPSVCSCFSVSF